MSRTIKHAARITLATVNDVVCFQIVKVLEGKESYVVTSYYGRDCYDAAMDMARDCGKNVLISENAARLMTAWACDISHEWTVNVYLRDAAYADEIRKALGK